MLKVNAEISRCESFNPFFCTLAQNYSKILVIEEEYVYADDDFMAMLSSADKNEMDMLKNPQMRFLRARMMVLMLKILHRTMLHAKFQSYQEMRKNC